MRLIASWVLGSHTKVTRTPAFLSLYVLQGHSQAKPTGEVFFSIKICA